MARPRTVLTPQPERAERKRAGVESVWAPNTSDVFRCRRTAGGSVGASTYHATLAEARGVQEWITEPSVLEWLNRSAWSPVPEPGSPWWMAMWEILGREPE